MFLPSLLVVVGFLILGREGARDEKRALWLMAGIGMVGLGWAMTFARGGVSVDTVASLAAANGLGLLLGAGISSRRRETARAWFALGAIALTISVVLFAGRFLLTSYGSSELLLELGPDDEIEEVTGVLGAFGATWERAFPMIDLSEDADLSQVYLIRVSTKVEGALREALTQDRENVDHLEANLPMSIDLPPAEMTESYASVDLLENDPLASSQWALDAIHGHEAHRILAELTPARRAIVAIVDTGVDAAHEDLEGVFDVSPGISDLNGHGSHCAGIAGAATNNGKGIASLNWEGRFIQVTSFSALDAQGMGSVESTADAILLAAESGADVISLSLGAVADVIPKTMSDAVAYARRQGAVVIAAAGNSNEDAVDHVPSNIEGVISVSAVDQALKKASFSNTNASLSRPIAAPGVDILSLQTSGGYTSKSGTSMATPLVAGLAGILVSIRPEITDDELYDLLFETGRPSSDVARVGRVIDAAGALQRVLDGR